MGFGAKPQGGLRGASPHILPRHGCRACMPQALHDAEPIKHTQPFPGKGGRGIGIKKALVFGNSLQVILFDKLFHGF